MREALIWLKSRCKRDACAGMKAATLPVLQEREAGGGAAARGGASVRRRGAADADGMDADATGGIPTERSAPSTADGCRVLRRMREREPREPHKPATPKLSADRIGWAGDAAAASRASLSRRDAWRRTRTRRQSFDCRAVRGLSQAHFGTAGEVAEASPAY